MTYAPTTAPVDAVVFDVGGVLLDWSPQHLYRRLIPDADERHRFLTEICTPEWNAAQDAGRTWAEAVAELIGRFPAYAELITAYDQRWEEMVAGPFEESVGILEELRRSGVPTYALTNFSAEKWELAQQRWDFLAALDGCVVSGTERVMKPDPRIYRILLDRYGLDARRTFFTDDRQPNVDGARALGIQAEVFVDGRTLRRQLAERGVLMDGSEAGRDR